MSLRILFADDSVTAQNMGKKILTEAGYDVVAVSNGAAAVKKIAEQKPDIIILDVYMPGYSGLEVCEKVRSSLATIKTPVLLTVGKMEPYKAEDANRVRADGVIIKPFEASDLLAIVKKFEERIAQMPAPVAPAPAVPVRRPVEDIPEFEARHPEPTPTAVMQPMVEVPDHMATSSAFSDLLGSDSAPVPIPQAPLPISQLAETAAANFDVPVSWRQEVEPEPTVVAPPQASDTQVIEPVEEVPAVASAPVVAAPEPDPVLAAVVRAVPIPVFQDPAAPPLSYDMVPTSAGPIGDIDIPREPSLQESAEETTRNTVADEREPGLVPTSAAAEEQPATVHAEGMESATTQLPVQEQEPQPAVLQPQVAMEAAAGAEHSTPSLSDADFEARVAAAMAAYGNGSSAGAVAHAATVVTSEPEPAEPPATAAPVAEPEAPAPAATFEYQPPVQNAPVEAAIEEPQMAEPVAEPAQEATDHAAIAAKVEEELPKAAAAVAEAAAANPAEHENIAQVVHRVMERMKGDLVEEIVRELRKK
ncbi:MAG TPA: response regulator [Candidatus Limnocylindrales bacterium]|nr:response regulator [Candidatus Limnocylindrales bacterium]